MAVLPFFTLADACHVPMPAQEKVVILPQKRPSCIREEVVFAHFGVGRKGLLWPGEGYVLGAVTKYLVDKVMAQGCHHGSRNVGVS